MSDSSVSRVGTATRVRSSAGIPSLRSSLGSGRGPTTCATPQFTIAMATSEAGTSATTAISSQIGAQVPDVRTSGNARVSAVIAAIAPR